MNTIFKNRINEEGLMRYIDQVSVSERDKEVVRRYMREEIIYKGLKKIRFLSDIVHQLINTVALYGSKQIFKTRFILFDSGHV